MVDPEIVSRRILLLSETLQHLESAAVKNGLDLAANPMLRAAVERWLQVAIEACIDLAYHVIAERGWTPPETARNSFMTLASHAIIDRELATRLGSAVGMRNVLVHAYVAVDPEIIARAVVHDLADLKAFGQEMSELLTEH